MVLSEKNTHYCRTHEHTRFGTSIHATVQRSSGQRTPNVERPTSPVQRFILRIVSYSSMILYNDHIDTSILIHTTRDILFCETVGSIIIAPKIQRYAAKDCRIQDSPEHINFATYPVSNIHPTSVRTLSIRSRCSAVCRELSRQQQRNQPTPYIRAQRWACVHIAAKKRGGYNMWKPYRGDSRGRHRDRHHAVLLAFGLGSALATGACERCAGEHMYACGTAAAKTCTRP